MKRIGISLFLISVVSCFVLMTACKNEQITTIDSDLESNDSIVLYGNKDLKFPVFISSAEEAASQWSVYIDFEDDVKSINPSTLSEVRSKSERLVTYVDSLVKKIPDTIDTQPIYSRIIIVNTRIKLLEQAVNSKRENSERIQLYFAEMNQSIANLKVQINEKLQKDIIDLQRKKSEEEELEKQRKKIDSIIDSEKEN